MWLKNGIKPCLASSLVTRSIPALLSCIPRHRSAFVVSNPSSPIKLPLRVVTEEEPLALRSEPEDINLRVLRPLFRYVRAHHGEDTLHRVVREAGADPTILQRSAPWVSLAAFEAILSGARELVGSDGAFVKACYYDIAKVYGPMTLVMRSMTVGTTYRALARTSHLVSRVSHYEFVAGTRNSVTLRYFSKRPDSHLNCLSRQAQLSSVPSLWWGIPEAEVQANARLCDGDAYCEYVVRWREPMRLRYPLLGLAAGFILGQAAISTSLVSGFILVPVLLSAVGGLVGIAFQMRRMLVDYIVTAEETSYEVEHVVQAHARAVDELLALHQRERAWSNTLELRETEQRERLEQVVEALEGTDPLEEAPQDKLLHLSHDINNPLTVLLASSQNLTDSDNLDSDEREAASAIKTAARRIQALLGEMSSIVRGDHNQALPVDVINIDEMTHRIRRQLRATVLSRDIRVTVFQTREAPPRITTDALLLERVIDNLLTNACKYTHKGSIIVEVSGTPGHLMLKISDSGKGIGEDRLERVFIGGKADRNPLVGTSHGDGLAIVVRLLDHLSGRLEIMSTPGEGTTVWVAIPNDPPQKEPVPARSGVVTARDRFERVVRIRPRV